MLCSLDIFKEIMNKIKWQLLRVVFMYFGCRTKWQMLNSVQWVCDTRLSHLVLGLYENDCLKRSMSSLLGVFASSCPSVCSPAWNNPAPTGRVLIKFDIWYFVSNLSEKKIQVSLKSDKNNGYFTWRCFHLYDNISLNSS